MERILLECAARDLNFSLMFANALNSLSSTSLPANWFDVVVVLMLGFGLFRGRKNGMSKEILPLFQWLVAGLDSLTGNLLAYVILALAIFLIFSVVKRTLGLRLFGSNLFGGAEYYLGMLSGLIRFACMLMFALAFLNARHYTSAQIEEGKNFQTSTFGSNLFPDLYTVQDQVFNKSFTGPCIRNYLGVLLIEPTLAGSKPAPDAPAP